MDEELSPNNIKLIRIALTKLSESVDKDSESYDMFLLEIHRINFVLDNIEKLSKEFDPILN